jgi:hypothetical protein
MNHRTTASSYVNRSNAPLPELELVGPEFDRSEELRPSASSVLLIAIAIEVSSDAEMSISLSALRFRYYSFAESHKAHVGSDSATGPLPA